MLLLLSWRNLLIAFSKCIVSILICYYLPKCLYKRHLLLWIIFVDFSSALVTQFLYFIFFYPGNLLCSLKEAMILLLLAWLTLYIVLSSIVCPKPCILILICYFVNSMSNTVPLRKLCLKLIYFQSSFIYISGAPRKKYFKSRKCSESCLLILI